MVAFHVLCALSAEQHLDEISSSKNTYTDARFTTISIYVGDGSLFYSSVS